MKRRLQLRKERPTEVSAHGGSECGPVSHSWAGAVAPPWERPLNIRLWALAF